MLKGRRVGEEMLKEGHAGKQMLRGHRVGEEMVKKRHAGGRDVERASCWGRDG